MSVTNIFRYLLEKLVVFMIWYVRFQEALCESRQFGDEFLTLNAVIDDFSTGDPNLLGFVKRSSVD